MILNRNRLVYLLYCTKRNSKPEVHSGTVIAMVLGCYGFGGGAVAAMAAMADEYQEWLHPLSS